MLIEKIKGGFIWITKSVIFLFIFLKKTLDSS